MRNYTFLFLLFLAGCAVLRPPKFDSVQYSTVVDIRQLAQHTEMCETSDQQLVLALALRDKSIWLQQYTKHLYSNSNDVKSMINTFNDEIIGFVDQSKKSSNVTYCKFKLEEIADSSELVQKTLGRLQ